MRKMLGWVSVIRPLVHLVLYFLLTFMMIMVYVEFGVVIGLMLSANIFALALTCACWHNK